MKTKKWISLLAAVVMTLAFTACGAVPAQETPSDTAFGNVYTDNENKFSIDYPKDWTKTDYEQAVFAAVAPAGGGFQANINIVVDQTDSALSTLEKEFLEEQYSSMGIDAVVEDISDITLGGTEGRKGITTISYNGVDLHLEQYVVRGGGRAYVISGTCLQSELDTYQHILEDIAASFTILK